jgi:tight adherence protein B
VTFSLLLLIFLAASLGLAAGYSIWSDLARRDQSRAIKRVGNEFRKSSATPAPQSKLFKNLPGLAAEPPAPLGAAPPADAPIPGPEAAGVRARFEAMVAQSGLSVTSQAVLLAAGAAALVLGTAGGILGGFLFCALGFAAGAAAPCGYVWARRKARRDKFLRQLPDAFDLMARVMRSGHSVPQAFQSVADTFEQPIAAEFASCSEQQNLGLLPEVAYRELAQRTGILEMKIFVMAMLIQRQTGGSLSEVLERLATLVRERVRMHSRIRALTAEGRLQAVVLLVLPFVMFLVMRVVNRRYADLLLDHPSLIAGMLLMMGLGAAWIRKIINFDY